MFPVFVTTLHLSNNTILAENDFFIYRWSFFSLHTTIDFVYRRFYGNCTSDIESIVALKNDNHFETTQRTVGVFF